MADQNQTVGIVDQGVAGNSGGLLVGSGKSAVDDQLFAFGPDRAFAGNGLDGNMPVDQMALFRIDAEFSQDIFGQDIIVIISE